jgi:hypothetical protein
MKSWIYATMVVATAAFIGCDGGSSSSSTGGGGTSTGGTGTGGTSTGGMSTGGMSTGGGGTSTGGTGTGGTSTGGTSTGGSGGGGNGGSGGGTMTDCTTLPTLAECESCFAMEYPVGSMLYGGLITCITCSACYTACDGMGAGCPMPPVQDACDDDGTGTVECGDNTSGCTQCSLGGSCSDELGACQQNPACLDFAGALQGCPQN